MSFHAIIRLNENGRLLCAAKSEETGDDEMPEIKERINSYQPLWGSWYNDAYIGGSSSAMLFRLRQDRDGERLYSAVAVIPAIYTGGLPETRIEREQFIDQQKALASREIKEMYSLRGKPYLVQCLADKQINIYDGNKGLIGYDLLLQTELYGSLRSYLNESGPLSARAVSILAVQLATALRSLHSAGLLHGRLSPDCLQIDRGGNYILGGYGLLSRTIPQGASAAAGVAYMAPEVWAAGRSTTACTVASDIFSYGMTLYYLLNNNSLPLVPVGGALKDEEDAIYSRLNGRGFPEPVNGSKELKAVVMRCLAYDPSARFGSFDEVLAALSFGDRTEAVMPAAPYPAPEAPETVSPDSVEYDKVYEEEDEEKKDLKYNSRLKTMALIIFAVLIVFMTAMILIMLFVFKKEHENSSSVQRETTTVIAVDDSKEELPSATTTTTTTTEAESAPDPNELQIPGKLEHLRSRFITNAGTSVTAVETRYGPGGKYGVIKGFTIPTGTKVDIYAEEIDPETLDTWGFLTYDNTRCWVNEKYMSEIVEPDEIAFQRTMFVNTQEDKLTLRVGPGYDHDIILEIDMYEDVDVYAEKYLSAENETWCYVTYKKKWGWVNGQYLGNMADKDKATETEPPETAPPVTEPPTIPADVTEGNPFTLSYATTTLYEDLVSYSARYAVDGNSATCWSEGSPGSGIDESITIATEDGSEVEINTIYIANGILKSEKSFYNNNRVRECEIVFSDGRYVEIELNGEYSEQPCRINLNEAVSTSSITIIIKSVYSGEKYDDTCISEISAAYIPR